MVATVQDLRRRARLALILRTSPDVERARKPARVRTPAGVKRYDQPIGSLIVPNLLDNLRSWIRGGQRGPDPLADVQSQADVDQLAREVGLPAGSSADSVKAAAVRKVAGDMPARKSTGTKATKASAKKATGLRDAIREQGEADSRREATDREARATAAAEALRESHGGRPAKKAAPAKRAPSRPAIAREGEALLEEDTHTEDWTPEQHREFAKRLNAMGDRVYDTGAGVALAHRLKDRAAIHRTKANVKERKAARTSGGTIGDALREQGERDAQRESDDREARDRGLRESLSQSHTREELEARQGRKAASGGFDESKARTYKSSGAPKRAERREKPATITAEWGEEQHFTGPWYAVLDDDGKVKYGAAAKEWEAQNEQIPGKPGQWRKVADVQAYQHRGAPKRVETVLADGTRETSNTANSGDWIVKQANGEVQVVPDAEFRQRYDVGSASRKSLPLPPVKVAAPTADQKAYDALSDADARAFVAYRRTHPDVTVAEWRAQRKATPAKKAAPRKAAAPAKKATPAKATTPTAKPDRRAGGSVNPATARQRITSAESAEEARAYLDSLDMTQAEARALARELGVSGTSAPMTGSGRAPRPTRGGADKADVEGAKAAIVSHFADLWEAGSTPPAKAATPAKKATPAKATPRKATRPTAPEGMVRKPFPDSATTPAARVAHLRSIDTREQAQDAIADLKRKDLADIARELGVPGTGSLTIDQLRAEIVQTTVGRRIDSISTRGFTGDRPGETGETAQEFSRRTRREAGLPPGTESPGSAPQRDGDRGNVTPLPPRTATPGSDEGSSTPATDLSDYRRALDNGLSPRDAAAYAAWVRDNPGGSIAQWQASRREREQGVTRRLRDMTRLSDEALAAAREQAPEVGYSTRPEQIREALARFNADDLLRIADAFNVSIPSTARTAEQRRTTIANSAAAANRRNRGGI